MQSTKTLQLFEGEEANIRAELKTIVQDPLAWLSQPNDQLGGKRPQDLIDDGGTTAVSGPTGAAPTQELGDALYKSTPFEGFRTVSAKLPISMILGVFPKKLSSRSRLVIKDHTGRVIQRIPWFRMSSMGVRGGACRSRHRRADHHADAGTVVLCPPGADPHHQPEWQRVLRGRHPSRSEGPRLCATGGRLVAAVVRPGAEAHRLASHRRRSPCRRGRDRRGSPQQRGGRHVRGAASDTR